MGYWGNGVLDGDTPLDEVSRIEKLVGLKNTIFEDEEGYVVPDSDHYKWCFRKHFNQEKYIKDLVPERTWDYEKVLATVITLVRAEVVLIPEMIKFYREAMEKVREDANSFRDANSRLEELDKCDKEVESYYKTANGRELNLDFGSGVKVNFS